MLARLAVTLGSVLALTASPTLAQTPAAPPTYPPVAGDALFAAGDLDAAALSYESTLRTDPHDAGAELGLARIALYRNDLAALETHAALAADNPSDPRAQRLLAAIRFRRGDAPDVRADPLAGDVDVPLVHVDPLPVLEANVDGKPARLLLDTGGSGLDLASTFAQKIGLATQTAGQGVFAAASMRRFEWATSIGSTSAQPRFDRYRSP
jgi:hypothetical protein